MRQRARGLRPLSQEGSAGGRESEEERQQGFDFDLHDFLTGPLQGSQRAPRDSNNLLTGWLLDKFDPTAQGDNSGTLQSRGTA